MNCFPDGNYIHDLNPVVRPVYDDSLFAAICGVNLCLGEPMDVTEKRLTPTLIASHILELTTPGVTYQTGELRDLVTERHRELGGADTEVTNPHQQFQRAMDRLQESFIDDGHGRWKRTEHELPSESVLTEEAFENAEIRIGEGAEVVYAWYLPIYREPSKLKDEATITTFPMKVGRTNRTAEDRVRESIGALPERPIVGFVWRTDDSVSGEKVLHGTLALRGRHLPDAIGNEWYLTNPEELRCIISEPQSLLPKG